jgi:hypothetical protein
MGQLPYPAFSTFENMMADAGFDGYTMGYVDVIVHRWKDIVAVHFSTP